MASQAQIDANRVNAQKSTGPRTAEGKAVSSQNAVRHGLFAREAVIHGEDPAEFELYREAYLADLRPVGPMESTLAERIVSLSWRLLRAERLQNEAINEQILKISGGRMARATRSLLPGGVRRKLADSGVMEPDPNLGQIFAKDSLDAWLLDRLQLYERRIETSMFRTIEQLRKFQRIREARESLAAAGQEGEQVTPAAKHKSDLKKRTQSSAGQCRVSSCATRQYVQMPSVGVSENKGNFACSERSLTCQIDNVGKAIGDARRPRAV